MADIESRAAEPRGFRLMRYFTITTLLAFVAVALVLWVLQRGEETFFADVQREQADFFTQAQARLARQHEEAARNSLLAVHEASHVNLTRLVANLLWATDFAPLVAQAQRLPVDDCKALPLVAAGAASAAASAPPATVLRRECLARVGQAIRALPGFASLDAKAFAAMRASTVFKIKVFDLRGVTVYSSEAAQVGEDGSGNQGWQSAVSGRPASELTHRDRFSAFERVVENRDLISTYVPVREGPADRVVGVVELYSDVTPFLVQIKAASQRFASITAANDAEVRRKSSDYVARVQASSGEFLLIVIGLLALLYGVSLLIVRHGQRQIDRQSLAQEEAARREQLWHREKMAALATMAANVSHEVGNPLAVIAGVAQQLPDSTPHADSGEPASRVILAQTARVGAMMRQISDFASQRSEAADCVDVNAMLKALCDFHAFDRRFRATPIDFRPGSGLPACQLVPDHLNEAMMNLLQVMADARPSGSEPVPLRVQTEATTCGVRIRVDLALPGAALAGLDAALAVDPRMDALRRCVAGMSGQLTLGEGQVQITLPGVPA